MRVIGLFVVLAALTGCGIKQYLPTGPVLSEADRDAGWSDAKGADVVYTSPPKVVYPVLPLQVWGITYDLDLVIVSDHPKYDMHEYARVQSPDGPVWFAKDALSDTKEQSIVADIENLERWVPELPVERKQSALRVADQSTDEELNVTITYENLDGQRVKAHYEGKQPSKQMKKRNGNTMGHSATIAMAVLDVGTRDFAKESSITIDGVPWKTSKIAGLKKFHAVLNQTQGGFATSDFWQEPAPEDDIVFTTFHKMRDGGVTRMDWGFKRGGKAYKVVQEAPLRTLSYTFRVHQGAVELKSMDVEQHATDNPPIHIELNPALPDMRRKFDGRHTSAFVVDVNGQQNHAVGRVEAWWDGETAKVAMIPEEPYWVADRPMETTISYDESKAGVKIVRTEPTDD